MGNASVLTVTDRPNLFVKELKMYLDYLKNEIKDVTEEINLGQIKKWNSFKNNLLLGIGYYEDLFLASPFFESTKKEILRQFDIYKSELIAFEIPELKTI